MPIKYKTMFTLSILSVFLIALVMMELLCVAVVLYHCLKTVRMNPANALKNE